MNRPISPSTDQHQQTLLLLPWYLNKSLEQNERQQVENHLRNCIVCNRELVVLRKMAAAIKQSSDLNVAAEASFASLRKKMQVANPAQQKPDPPSNHPTLVWPRKHANATPGLSGNIINRYSRLLRLNSHTVKPIAIAASLLLAMFPLLMQYVQSPVTTDYYTLSAAKPEATAGTKLRVVFAKSLPDAGIDALLEKIHGQIIEGPNSAGAYTVRLSTDKDSLDSNAAIALLRNHKDVLLAEPVIGL